VRTALITGASRGIGRGIAVELARQGFGLTISARSSADLDALADALAQAGAGKVVCHAADLADRTVLPALIAQHRETFHSMDALLLSGGVGTAGPIATMHTRRADKTLEVNFTSALTLIQHALPLLRTAAQADPSHAARIIALASITGIYAEPGLAAYGASKAALISLSETLNAEESGNGVMATAIAPGYVATDMSAWTTDTIPVATMIPVDDIVAIVRMLLSLGRTTCIPRIILSRAGTSGYHA